MPEPIRRQMTPAEQAALWSQGSQGMQPQMAPMSLADLAMEGVGAFLDEVDVSKYLLPATLAGLVRYKRPGVSSTARQAAERVHRAPVQDPIQARALELNSWNYPLVPEFLEGRTIRSHIPNQGSVDSTFNEYEILPGVRRIPMREFPGAAPRSMFYASDDIQRARKLAGQISRSGEINPLIVAVDPQGPYVLEGAHRMSALHDLGAEYVPARVVLDRDQMRPLPYPGRARAAKKSR